jgi:hypothetical protein
VTIGCVDNAEDILQILICEGAQIFVCRGIHFFTVSISAGSPLVNR